MELKPIFWVNSCKRVAASCTGAVGGPVQECQAQLRARTQPVENRWNLLRVRKR